MTGVSGNRPEISLPRPQPILQPMWRAQVAYLKSRNEIDATKIGLIGHSEGGLIAPMVASDSEDVDFIVMLAGPGIRGDKILFCYNKS